MLELLRKNMKKIMWGITLLFVGGIFFWYGSGNTAGDVVANVGRKKIRLRDFQNTVARHLNRERANNQEITDEKIMEIRRNTLGSMISQELKYTEALKLGITVTNEEIMGTIQNMPQPNSFISPSVASVIILSPPNAIKTEISKYIQY